MALPKTLSVLALVLLSSRVFAGSLDADFRPEGTVLTYAFRGVTLTVAGGSGGTVVSKNGFDTFNNRNLATTGRRVFGYEPPKAPIMSGKVWDERLGLLRADFASPVSKVQIDVICDDDDEGALWAYDAAGNLIGFASASCDGREDVRYATVSIHAIRPVISYVTAGGLGAEALFLDNLRYSRFAPDVQRHYRRVPHSDSDDTQRGGG